MISGKFKRLVIVLALPLLTIGAWLVHLNNRQFTDLKVRCAPLLLEEDYCESTGWGDNDSYVASRFARCFDIRIDRSNDPSAKAWSRIVSVSGSPRAIYGVNLVSFKPLLLSSSTSSVDPLQQLNNNPVDLYFPAGASEREGSPSLDCGALIFERSSPDTFGAECSFKGQNGVATFSADASSSNKLMSLKKKIVDVSDEYRAKARLSYLMLPVPLLLFLALSGIVWIVRRGSRYVAEG